MSEKLYADRNARAQGRHYTKHVEAMTAEDLHSKSDIAAELAHRDIEIERLQEEIFGLRNGQTFCEKIGEAWVRGGYLDRLMDMTDVDNAERIVNAVLPKLNEICRTHVFPHEK